MALGCLGASMDAGAGGGAAAREEDPEAHPLIASTTSGTTSSSGSTSSTASGTTSSSVTTTWTDSSTSTESSSWTETETETETETVTDTETDTDTDEYGDCGQCVQTRIGMSNFCWDLYQDCQTVQTPCAGYIQCRAACGDQTNMPCVAQCAEDHPVGATQYGLLYACAICNICRRWCAPAEWLCEWSVQEFTVEP